MKITTRTATDKTTEMRPEKNHPLPLYSRQTAAVFSVQHLLQYVNSVVNFAWTKTNGKKIRESVGQTRGFFSESSVEIENQGFYGAKR
jgi:hypothetical protein